MAGAGYKSWVVGEKLTAAHVNTFLMEQSVMNFASAAARDAALDPPSEGMCAFLDDTNEFCVYDGSAWRLYNTSWTAYTPTLANVNLGSGGSVVGFYTTSGRMTIVHVFITLGTAGFSVSGIITASMPANRAYASTARFTGTARMAVAGTTYPGSVIGSSGNMLVYAHNASATYLSVTGTSSIVPNTWAASNTCLIQAIYES
jgi:hypothetical protein